MKKVAKLGAYTAIILGTFGMLVCLPFLFSARLIDVIGAGFPFVGGAIITSAGLLTLATLSKKEKTPLENVITNNPPA